jgi:hypothetical protein
MRRGLAWLGGALGLAALWRFLQREHEAARPLPPPAPAPAAEPEPAGDPAAALRAKLDEARETVDDRDEFDEAEGQPLDEVERPEPAEPSAPVESSDPRSLEERRRAIHEKAQEALGEMQRPPE